MRYSLVVVVVTFGLGDPGWPQRLLAATTDQTAAIDFVQKAVPRALDYDQGNHESLVDAKDDFTPDGWREFMKWLAGFLDDKGAPTGSSLFSATGAAVVKSNGIDIIRLAIPGTLKQQSKNAYGGLFTTTYRVTVEIEVSGNPLKIQHLKTTTCGSKPCD